MAHAIVIRETGDASVMHYEEIETPTPGAGEVLVRTHAIGINYIDVYFREGKYPMDLPFVLGKEAAGEIVAVGEGVTDLSIGDRIASTEIVGAYATHVRVAAETALPIPDGVSYDVAAALPLQGMTAHYLVNSSFDLETGHTCIVHAAAGGVGLLLTQMAKAKGARVIATVSTPEKADLAKHAGADLVVGYEDFVEKSRAYTDGVGVDVVYDGVGEDTFDGSLESLRVRGTLVSFGSSSGQVPPVDIARLMRGGSLTLTRPSLWSFLLTPEERRWRSSEVFGAAANGTLDVRVGAVFPLSDAGSAHEALTSRRTTGKVVLIPGD